MKRLLLPLLSFVLAAWLCSCTSLKSKYYPGTVVESEKGNIGKTLICNFNEQIFLVNTQSKDEIVMGHLEWDEKKHEFKAVNNKVVVSKLKENTLFFNILGDDGLYTILKFAPGFNKNAAVLYSVKKEKIQQDIKDGKIKAASNKDQSEFVMELTKDELDKYILENMDTLFDYNNPGVVSIQEISK